MSVKRMITAGIDVGTGAVKAAVVGFDHHGNAEVLGVHRERIHRREAAKVAQIALAQALDLARIRRPEVAYVATTGEADEIHDRDGHFYGMTTHARGASFLVPEAQAVLDVGALHARAMIVDEKSRVLRSKMTSQCASGTGQFLENIARYLGIRSDEVGPLSLAASRAEACSGICAVLSETDVINMVSRSVPTGEILRGVHDSISGRLARLVRGLNATGVVAVTGGLSTDTGLIASLERAFAGDRGVGLKVVAHPLGPQAGAIGAALWGQFRATRLGKETAAEARA